jgi:hypothetical protein
MELSRGLSVRAASCSIISVDTFRALKQCRCMPENRHSAAKTPLQALAAPQPRLCQFEAIPDTLLTYFSLFLNYGDRAGFRESFAAESAVKRSVAPSPAGPSSGHLLPLVNDGPHHLIPRHCPDHLRRNTEQMRMVRLDVCYFLACNRI